MTLGASWKTWVCKHIGVRHFPPGFVNNYCAKNEKILDSDGYMFLLILAFQMYDLKWIVYSIAKYFTIVWVKAQFDQMIEGLCVVGVHDLMKCSLHKLMTQRQTLPNADLLNLFYTDFSDVGSKKRDLEEQAVVNFIQLDKLVQTHIQSILLHRLSLQCILPVLMRFLLYNNNTQRTV